MNPTLKMLYVDMCLWTKVRSSNHFLSRAGVHAKLYFEMRSDLSLLQKANLSVPFSGPIIGSRKLLQSWVAMIMKVKDVQF